MSFRYTKRKMAKLFANSRGPDQMPRAAASDLGLHCLPIIHLEVSRLQWIKNRFFFRSQRNNLNRVTTPESVSYPLKLSQFGKAR